VPDFFAYTIINLKSNIGAICRLHLFFFLFLRGGCSTKIYPYGAVGATVKVLSWTVSGLNCPIKGGNVKWVSVKFSCVNCHPLRIKHGRCYCCIAISL